MLIFNANTKDIPNSSKNINKCIYTYSFTIFFGVNVMQGLLLKFYKLHNKKLRVKPKLKPKILFSKRGNLKTL